MEDMVTSRPENTDLAAASLYPALFCIAHWRNPHSLSPSSLHVFHEPKILELSSWPIKFNRTIVAPREKIGPNLRPFDTTRRTVFGEFGCCIFGYPSTGGVIIRVNADLVELKQLNFDPLNPPPTRSSDQEREDAFCAELRKVGSKWWRSQKRFEDVPWKDWNDTEPTDEELRNVWFGWPKEGGLLVLQCEQDERPDDIGRLRMAETMEERCWILRESLMRGFMRRRGCMRGLLICILNELSTVLGPT